MKTPLFLLALLLPAAAAQAQLISPQTEQPAPAAPAVTAEAAPIAPAPPQGRVMIPQDIAVLQVLDKVSARTTTLRVPVNSSAAFGQMMMLVRSCQIAPPSETPEAAAFIEVSEVDLNRLREGSDPLPRPLYSGWMFASSPALAALEHPIYDITVIACEPKTPSPAARAAEAAAGQAKPAPTPGDADPAALPQD